MTQPPQTSEYTYMVGQVPITAMLTEEQAAAYGAVPVEPAEPTEEDTTQQETGPDVNDKARRPRKRD